MLKKYSKCHKSPTNGPTGTQLVWSHPIMPPTCPPWCGCHGNGRCLATMHCTLSSCGRLETERVNQSWWNLVSKRKLGPQWQSRDQILFFFNSKWLTAAMLENIRNVITRLPMYRLRPNLGGHIPSCPWHVPTIRLPWQQPLPCNGALYIQQLWASGGRTREWWNLVHNSKLGP